MIEDKIPDIYVYSIEVGDSIEADEWNGFFMNVNDQVDYVCGALKADPQLKGGFNAVGFSQGGQFLRAYVERCNDPPVYNLISIGGQHFGVADMPGCTSVNDTICYILESLLAFGAYNEIVQYLVVQAQYFRDPMQMSNYLSSSGFLADINNERATKNATYKANLIQLNTLVLGKFAEDTVVVPRESEWFGRYVNGNVNQILSMEDTDLYQEDWIGLKVLNEAGKIKLLSIPGNHMQFGLSWFTDNVIAPYLKN